MFCNVNNINFYDISDSTSNKLKLNFKYREISY